MSTVNPEAGSGRVRTHTLRFLPPARSLATGMPTSCTGACHPGKDAAWAAGAMKGWR